MAKFRAHIAFCILMSSYFLIRYLRVTVDDLPNFVRFHLTDLLFVPAMSLFALIILRFLRRDNKIIIHWSAVFIQVILVSFYFEWYLPDNEPEGHVHVGDLMDCLMYLIGGIVFVFSQPYLTIETKKNGTRNTDSEM